MVSTKIIDDQLKKLGFKVNSWGRTEVNELHNIILPDEEIFECVNGIYEGGFAMLLATDIRVLLVDKKPLNYLMVEDLRFDMINEIDYNHRLIGAYITIATGNKNLRFTSFNQHRLRKLIGHVQHSMAEIKKNQVTHPHLEQINRQLQSYLLAQYEQQQKLQDQLQKVQANQVPVTSLELPAPVKPSPELADYLYARRLLEQHQTRNGQLLEPADSLATAYPAQTAELREAGMEEVYGKRGLPSTPAALAHHPVQTVTGALSSLEINPLKVAYAKLPLVLKHRKISRLSLSTPHVPAPGSQRPVSLSADA